MINCHSLTLQAAKQRFPALDFADRSDFAVAELAVALSEIRSESNVYALLTAILIDSKLIFGMKFRFNYAAAFLVYSVNS
jgi:hypothetical protein